MTAVLPFRRSGLRPDRAFTLKVHAGTEFRALQTKLMAEGQVPCADPHLAETMWSEVPAIQREAAKSCTGCPVQDQCLAYALVEGEYWGVWGGVDEWTRNQRPTRGRPRKDRG